ncbi:leukocyte receptor cluster member 1-like [Penaeus indicus]|uniref:leukocyte receptor cluster member 1-like n=1 Tax=Penaeus indicus TaxID=29960 RepID=UPI00300C3F29
MNILPKKRWHVRTKENIARVRRDEAQAAEEEKQRVYRAKLAEKEARTAILRAKAQDGYDGGYSSQEAPEPQKKSEGSADIYTADGNINFFKDLEDGKKTHGTNKEYEEEKKAEQEKYEKSIGYLTYLGQDSVEATGGKAWYEGSDGRAAYRDKDGEDVQEVGLKSKSKLDPMNEIRKYMDFKPSAAKASAPPASKPVPVKLEKKEDTCYKRAESVSREKDDRHRRKESKRRKKHKKEKYSKKKKSKTYSEDTDDDSDRHRKSYKEKSSKYRKRKRDSSSDDSIDSSRDKKRKKHGKNSRRPKNDNKHRKRHQRSSSSDSTSCTQSSELESSEDEEARKEKEKKLEVLRAERLKREAEERRRAERLLAGLNPNEKDVASENKPAVKQKYHSQFNPHLAKQNMEPKPLQSGVKYWLQ